MEVVFEVRDDEDGGFNARAIGHLIFTEGETWGEIEANVKEATELHFEDEPEVPSVRLVRVKS